MKFILIDTNIFIFCALLTKEGHDFDVISKLTDTLKKDKAKLLLPEIIEIEYFKKLDEIFAQNREAIKSLKKQIKEFLLLYLAINKQDILSTFDQVLDKQRKNKILVNDKLRALFTSIDVIHIPLTSDILLNAYKRVLKGIKPFNRKYPSHLLNADCIIIESLLAFLKDNRKINKLLFCSDNYTDFAKKDIKTYIIHPDIAKDFQCEISYYRTPHELMAKEFKVVVDKEDIKEFNDSVKSLYIHMSNFFKGVESFKETQQIANNLSNFCSLWSGANPESMQKLNEIIQNLNRPLTSSLLKQSAQNYLCDYFSSLNSKNNPSAGSRHPESTKEDDSSDTDED